MLTHHLTSSLRNIRKNKLNFIINLVGLSLGLASAFIISSYVLKETSYDNFHEKKDRIARVLCDNLNVDWTSPGVPYIIKDHIDKSIPAVETSCLTNYLYMARFKQGEEFVRHRGVQAVTPEFLKIFDFTVLEGSLENALTNNSSIVLTEKLAKILFPETKALGQTIEIQCNNSFYQLQVDAVVENFPSNSSFWFSALCPINLAVDHFESMPWAKEFTTGWGFNFNRMFLVLKDKKNGKEEFQSAWNQFEKENDFTEKQMHFHLQSLSDIHLGSTNFVNDGNRGNKKLVYLFSSIAFIILIVAAFNYIILSISVSKLRYKEIGIKKVLGSHSKMLRKQFLTESILLSIFAFPIAYLTAYLSIDWLNQLFSTRIEINLIEHPKQLLTFIALILLIGILSGSYIAIYLSRLNPVEIIKSKLNEGNKKIRFQYIMLLFQIVIFTGLMGASFSIFNQIQYLKNMDTGIDHKNKLLVEFRDLELNHSSYNTLYKIIDDLPEVESFCMGYGMPPENSRSVMTAPDPSDETKNLKYEGGNFSYEFFDFFSIQCLQGRVFDKNLKTDSNKIVVNEAFVKLFKFDEPVGKKVNDKEIIGVIKDFYTHSLHEEVVPTAFKLIEPRYISEIGIEYKDELASQCTEKLKHELSKFAPDDVIEIRSLEAKIDDLYYDDNKFNNIIIYFSIFAIVIALIGIFGQSMFSVRQQVREIGIRKVNGASDKSILLQTLKKYTLLCLAANVISWPIINILMVKWQESFAVKSPLSIWLILVTLSLTILVVLGTVLSNAWIAARTNPVDVLKEE
jgi:putative ABC transport system permease protein